MAQNADSKYSEKRGVDRQAFPKYPKQVHNIFAIKKQLKESAQNEVDFLPAEKCQMFP